MLQISLGRILKAAIAFKGLMIEWVVVRGHNETLDVWTESRHKVFRKVTENAHAAMLHFSSPTLPELAVRSFMVRSVVMSVCCSLSWFAVYRLEYKKYGLSS
jgi:mediator of RNA polymerase II transcription subunit 27